MTLHKIFIAGFFSLLSLQEQGLYARLDLPKDHPLTQFFESKTPFPLQRDTILYSRLLDMDLYSRLGLSQTATTDEIKERYRKLSFQLHPDRAGPRGEPFFIVVSEAHKILHDSQERAHFDQYGMSRAETRAKRAESTRKARAQSAPPPDSSVNSRRYADYFRAHTPPYHTLEDFIKWIEFMKNMPLTSSDYQQGLDRYVQEHLQAWIETTNDFDELFRLSYLVPSSESKILIFKRMRSVITNKEDLYSFLTLVTPFLDRDPAKRKQMIEKGLHDFENKFGKDLPHQLLALIFKDLERSNGEWTNELQSLTESLSKRLSEKPELKSIRSLVGLLQSPTVPVEVKQTAKDAISFLLETHSELRIPAKPILPSTMIENDFELYYPKSLLSRCTTTLKNLSPKLRRLLSK